MGGKHNSVFTKLQAVNGNLIAACQMRVWHVQQLCLCTVEVNDTPCVIHINCAQAKAVEQMPRHLEFLVGRS